jgi:4-hydroxybenzoate polyprenyltransferase
MFKKLNIILADIKVQHTVFALPFAIISAFVAAEGLPAWDKLFWIVVAMVGGRSAAMAFNRIVDATYDGLNPRTEVRALPAGRVGRGSYTVFLVASAALLVFASYMLNPLAFALSPIALIIVFGYSLTKRFTAYSHAFLGLAIAVAPVGAWVAVREEISLLSLVLGAVVLFWLIGFDIIYSCMDVDSDKRTGLNSIPKKFGVERALKMAFWSHGLMLIFMFGMLFSPLLGPLYVGGVLLVAGLLWYEHSLVSHKDLSKVNIAFFNVNGWISLGLMAVVIVDCMWV